MSVLWLGGVRRVLPTSMLVRPTPGNLQCTLCATCGDGWRPGRRVGQYGLMDFLSKLKAEFSDLKDQLYETYDDCKIAKKGGFVVDLRGETYAYLPALCVPLRWNLGGVANLRGPRWSETVLGSQAWVSSTADITSELME
eukprot:4242714-Heterocapsa_arctica.AAC.1